MEEFIEKFNEFKEWLYKEETKCNEYGCCEEEMEVHAIIKKFEELGLDNAF